MCCTPGHSSRYEIINAKKKTKTYNKTRRIKTKKTRAGGFFPSQASLSRRRPLMDPLSFSFFVLSSVISAHHLVPHPSTTPFSRLEPERRDRMRRRKEGPEDKRGFPVNSRKGHVFSVPCRIPCGLREGTRTLSLSLSGTTPLRALSVIRSVDITAGLTLCPCSSLSHELGARKGLVTPVSIVSAPSRLAYQF